MDIGGVSRAGLGPVYKLAPGGRGQPAAEADAPDDLRSGYTSALSTIGSGSLAAVYKAMRAYDGAATTLTATGNNALALAESARSGHVAQALGLQPPVIGSAVGIPGAFAAYAQVLGD